MASGSEDGGAAQPPGEVEGWELPSMRDLFWKQQKLQRDGQTIYGNVWAGVRTLCSICSGPAKLLLACKPDEQSCGTLIDGLHAGHWRPGTKRL